MPERTINHGDIQTRPFTPQEPRNRPDSNPTKHDHDDRTEPE